MKRILSLILALVLALSLIPAAFAADAPASLKEVSISPAELASIESIIGTVDAFKQAGYPSMDNPSAVTDETLAMFAAWNIVVGNIEGAQNDDYVTRKGCSLSSAGYTAVQEYIQKYYGKALDLTASEKVTKPAKSELEDQIDLTGTAISPEKIFVFDGSLYCVKPPEKIVKLAVKDCHFYEAAGAGYLVSYGLFEEHKAVPERVGYAVMKKISGECQLIRNFDAIPSDDDVRQLLGATMPTGSVVATPTASPILLNGQRLDIHAYNINGSNYFKLRDIAYVLSGTSCRFGVGWNAAKKSIIVTPGNTYTVSGGELSKPTGNDKAATLSPATLICRGKDVGLNAYTIGGNTYFKLRDLGELFGFKVSWNESERIIYVTTPN